jgi:predicted RNA-binding Zn ribbon-like protein
MKEPSLAEVARVRFGGMQTPEGFLFELTGGQVCLDLANTLDERGTDHSRELLLRYEDLLNWGVQAGVLAGAEADALRIHAARHPRAATNALRRMVTAREAIFDIFTAAAGRRAAPPGALAALNRFLPGVFSKRRLEVRDCRFTWTWRFAKRLDLDRLLWPAVWSAAELLTSPELDRVRQCEGAGCAWLFMDTSKNRTRRWCDMSVCGNRAKAKRHYAKARTLPSRS